MDYGYKRYIYLAEYSEAIITYIATYLIISISLELYYLLQYLLVIEYLMRGVMTGTVQFLYLYNNPAENITFQIVESYICTFGNFFIIFPQILGKKHPLPFTYSFKY